MTKLRPLLVVLFLLLSTGCRARREQESARLRTQAAKEWSKRATTQPQR